MADIRVRASRLRGIAVPTELVPLAIDEFPAIAVAAACAQGETLITGAEELRVKESDRIAAIANGLAALGIAVEALPDGLRIQGGRFRGGVVESHGDHRIAMAFSLAALRADGAGADSRLRERRHLVSGLCRAHARPRPGHRGSVSEAPVVTIDGPGGAGKGTVSLLLARRLGWHYLDSGALYRLVAVAAARDGIDIDDGDALARRVPGLRIEFRVLADALQVLLDGVDVTAAIREEACARAASRLAVHARLRAALLPLQRAFARPPGLVAEGRDMGTVVFPQAPLKIFLTASAEQRARRRWLQLSAGRRRC